MKLLLDTHALLWWLSDDTQLGPRARDLVATGGDNVLVSTVSLWEIVVKVRVGKMQAEIRDILRSVERDGFGQLAVAAAHLVTLQNLPKHPEHRDPFDHLLVAQAITEGAALLSADRSMRRYAVEIIGCAE